MILNPSIFLKALDLASLKTDVYSFSLLKTLLVDAIKLSSLVDELKKVTVTMM